MVFESINKIWAQPLRYGLFTFCHRFWIIIINLKMYSPILKWGILWFLISFKCFAIESIYRRLLNWGGEVNLGVWGRKILFCITTFFSVTMTKTFQRLTQLLCQPTPIVSVLSLESGRIVKFVASVSALKHLWQSQQRSSIIFQF